METLWVGRGSSTLDVSKSFTASRTIADAMDDVTSNGCCLFAITVLPGIRVTEAGDEVTVAGGGVLTELNVDTLSLPSKRARRGIPIPGAEPKPSGLKVRYVTYGPKAGGRKTRRRRRRTVRA